ncbi:hypothetical protein BXZ70DRAFT_960715 [Cristinia sonorae]|uniref:Uncharacterized protein n=1 Tax=Cristinia sonorae TaxID=1940300 RepID=A0A8K0XK27_9AGAR|nr:hypothetical protein BXZ70DRAFT_960715 [Cristinia sonorae]
MWDIVGLTCIKSQRSRGQGQTSASLRFIVMTHSPAISEPEDGPSHSRHNRPLLLVRVTGLRLLNTSVLAGVGIAKAVLVAQGKSAAPAVLEWILGVICAIALYWVGLFEEVDPPLMPWLLHRDYAPEIVLFLTRFPGAVLLAFFQGILAQLLSTILFILPQLLITTLLWRPVMDVSDWSVAWILGTIVSWLICATTFHLWVSNEQVLVWLVRDSGLCRPVVGMLPDVARDTAWAVIERVIPENVLVQTVLPPFTMAIDIAATATAMILSHVILEVTRLHNPIENQPLSKWMTVEVIVGVPLTLFSFGLKATDDFAWRVTREEEIRDAKRRRWRWVLVIVLFIHSVYLFSRLLFIDYPM